MELIDLYGFVQEDMIVGEDGYIIRYDVSYTPIIIVLYSKGT